MMRETAIVLGATGAVGKQLVNQLSRREDVINIVKRPFAILIMVW